MKKALLLSIAVFMYACAPLVCPEEKQIKTIYSEDSAPKEYKAFLSIRYGIIKIPIYVEKEEGSYIIRSPQSGSILFSGRAFCINSACIDLPLTPDSIVFGSILTGYEKATCSFGSVVFERDDQAYFRKYVFSNGELKRIELTDKKKDRLMVFEYGERSKDGYYKSVKVSIGNVSFIVGVDELRR
ncbi:MAG: hypothetical protein ACK4SM_06520 [Aquificaceae bacterium]